ncbi:unnamed protein product [Pipistrellus nathusii]|uniref:Uncharacterized protein n=1 Tax=Pipistrellus nathusii TaxID=59473 RepID=A0ABN9ZXM4_PIPNA
MAVRSWLRDLADEVSEWLVWLDQKIDKLGLKPNVQAQVDFLLEHQGWYTLLSWHLILMVVIFLLVYGWVSSCSYVSAAELRARRMRKLRREEAASARRRRRAQRESTPAPPQATASHLAVPKSPRGEEKRPGKKQSNLRDSHRERHPRGRPLPTSNAPHVARPAIKPETHVSAPTGYRSRDPLMHRMALHRRDDSEDLETFYIWIKPNGQAAEVSDMKVSRFPRSETATQPLGINKRNEGPRKPVCEATAMHTCFCESGKNGMPWWVRLEEGSLRLRKPPKM